MSTVRFLTLEELLHIARREGLIEVRDVGLLASAVARPQTRVFGEDAYPSIWEKAAALLESVGRNHALLDGNERLAWLGAVVFLRLNGRRIAMTDDAAVDLVLGVVTGQLRVGESARRLAQAEVHEP